MKRNRIVFLVVVMAAVVVACRKENTAQKTSIGEVPTGLASKGGGVVFATEWQSLDKWQQDGRGFHTSRQLPMKAEGGKVLMFARKVWANDAPLEEPMEDFPMQLPFEFLPYTNQPGLSETWNYAVSGNEVKIDLQVSGGAEPATVRPVELRCVYIPDSVWTKLKTEGMEEEGLAYESLVHKLQIKP